MQARDSSGLYPAKRSPKYRLDRPITPAMGSYRLQQLLRIHPAKERVKDIPVGKFTIDPWTVEVSGLVNNPKKYDFRPSKALSP